MRAAVSNAMQRRALESEIHSDAEKLDTLMAELQNQRIEDQMTQTRGEIYASIIHDLNGPLTVISGFVHLMNQRIGPSTHLEVEDLQFIKDRLKTITRQATNCIEISKRYLGFLRGRSEDAPRVAVNQLLADLGHLIRVHPSIRENEFLIEPFSDDLAVRYERHGLDPGIAESDRECFPGLDRASHSEDQRGGARAPP
jgi:signal transduction histidine kinase